jgi:carbonic anhydrase
MEGYEELIGRNERFAAEFQGAELTVMPTKGTVIVTCMDPRVDPVGFVGLGLGEAAVIRNVGGRVTDDVIRYLSVLHALVAGKGAAPAILIVHHTDCGASKFDDPDLVAALDAAGVGFDARRAIAITDPQESARADVARVRATGVIPPEWTIAGFVYEVETGRLIPAGSPEG